MDKGAAPALKNQSTRVRYPKPMWFWIGAATFLILAIPTLIWVPGMLLENWMPDATADERNRALGTAGQVVLFALGGIIAVVGVALSLSRHGEELKAAAASDERELRSRFLAAVDLLSDDNSGSKRTAGVYALAALADDWLKFGRPDETQVCIDVLCGYLRSPSPNEAVRTPPEEVIVRSSGFNLIDDHLRDGHAASWSNCRFNLEGVVIDYLVSFSNSRVHELIDLSRATITNDGRLFFHGARLSSGAWLSLLGLKIHDGGRVDFGGTTVEDDGVLFLSDTTMNGDSELALNGVMIEGGGEIHLDGAEITDRARVSLQLAHFNGRERAWTGKQVFLEGVSVEKNGQVLLDGATIVAGGRVDLHGASITETGPIVLPDERRLSPPERAEP